MNTEGDNRLESWTAQELLPELLESPLPDAEAKTVVEHLKLEADRYWYIDPHRSLNFADRIIDIGELRGDMSQIALGKMARGDALKFLGRNGEAWEALDEAGRLFQSVGDDVGWARTRIGRVYLSTVLNKVSDALADAELARAIFTSHDEYEKLLRLHLNTALVHSLLGDQYQALRLYHAALTIAKTLGPAGEQYLGPLQTNIGLAHESLGDFAEALTHYERAREIYIARNETLYIAVIELNIAYIAQSQGRYRRALHTLYGILQRGIEKFPVEHQAVNRDMIECFLNLNRYVEARDLAKQVISEYRSLGATHDIARNLLHLATAEAELNHLPEAQAALAEAEPIFASLGADTWVATAQLRRAGIALKQGDHESAREVARVAADCFESNGQKVNFARAMLLQGQAQLGRAKLDEAALHANRALNTAQRFHVPSLRYSAHLLLGRISHAQFKTTRALRHYQAAAGTVERVQRGLTITLRQGFLEDKEEASRNLIGLYLQTGQVSRAFDALERVKSQVVLGYLGNQEQFHWATGDSRTRVLIEELDGLRAEHQWFYRLAHDPPRDAGHPSAVRPEQALSEISVREKRMHSITEQLYLLSGEAHQTKHIETSSLNDVQHNLEEGTALVEFYVDEDRLWAFTLDGKSIRALPLSKEIGALSRLLTQLKGNIAATLALEPGLAMTQNLLQSANRILKKLHSLLIEPLMLHEYNLKKLIVVPYGILHYLPFNILYDGSDYLIQKYEVVILPAAGLVTTPGPSRHRGALILANSQEGRLPQTLAEAQTVQRLFGGTLCADETATRDVLQAAPSQILHIAAHGQHRLDQPDLSYLQLADGQLYADDMLQNDMSYELVTLSACETGRASVGAMDELIGLGRGFLYAGAGALLVSMWKVADHSTLFFMERVYGALRSGESKSAAVREAQQLMLRETSWSHPAFWGAFQFIGNPQPLSSG